MNLQIAAAAAAAAAVAAWDGGVRVSGSSGAASRVQCDVRGDGTVHLRMRCRSGLRHLIASWCEEEGERSQLQCGHYQQWPQRQRRQTAYGVRCGVTGRDAAGLVLTVAAVAATAAGSAQL